MARTMRCGIVGVMMLVAACGEAAPSKRPFCATAMSGLANIVLALEAARDELERAEGACATVRLHVEKASAAASAYLAAATPFRDDPEVGKVLEVLDGLNARDLLIWCEGTRAADTTPAQRATNAANLDKVTRLFERAISTCRRPSP